MPGLLAMVVGVATLSAQTNAPARPEPIARAIVSTGPTPNPALLVGEKNAGRLAIIDPATLKVVARIPVGNQPHEVATDGEFAYISNSGASGVTLVDVAAQSRLPSIDMGVFGTFHGLWVAGGKLYISHEQSRVLTRYNPATARIEWVFGTGLGSHLLIVTEDERTIYLASSSTTSMNIMEMGGGRGGAAARAGGAAGGAGAARRGGGGGGRGGWTISSFPAGTRMEGIDISPDGKEFWAVSINDKKIIIVNIAEKKIVETFELPTVFTNRLKFTLDGKHVLMNELMGNQLFVYDAATRKEVKRIEIGAGGEGVFIDPNGTRAYYAVSAGNKLSVIDLPTLTVVGEVPDLQNPDGMAWYVSKAAK